MKIGFGTYHATSFKSKKDKLTGSQYNKRDVDRAIRSAISMQLLGEACRKMEEKGIFLNQKHNHTMGDIFEDKDGNRITKVYNQDGILLKETYTDKKGNLHAIEYDKKGQKIREQFFGGDIREIEYRKGKKIKERLFTQDEVIETQYNKNEEKIKETCKNGEK